MASRLSDELIEDIRAGNDIVELISEYLPLKKQGKNYVGLCPFHEEKKASFSVNPQRQIFHCFGCGIGGNIFKFLMEYQKMSFLDAVQFLAQRAHIELPAREKGIDDRSEYQPLYEANHLAAAHYHQQLLNSVDAEAARRYLQQRGFGSPITQTFRLGYAPPGWDGLIRRAGRHGISPEVLHRAGLVLKKDYGEGYYDRFRDRLIFPITNLSGKFIGFGGRTLQTSDEVKYINSPETPIYQKGKMLYGLFQTKGAIRKAGLAIIVEGYTDLLSLVQAGVENVVASLGTALTDHQARLLSRYAKEVILLYDADSAGVAAAERGIDVLLAAGLSARVFSLPAGMDPDQAVREKGRDYILKSMQQAESFLDFKLNHLQQRQGISSVDDLAETIESIGRTIRLIGDPIRRGLFIKETAEKLGVDEKIIVLSVEKASPKSSRGRRIEIGVGEMVRKGPELLERKVLALLLQNPDMIPVYRERIVPQDFENQDHRRIAERLLSMAEVRLRSPAGLVNALSDIGLDSLISGLCFLEEEGPADRLLDVSVRKIEVNRLVREERELREQMRNAEKKGDQALASRLNKRLLDIVQRRYQATSTSP